MTATSTNTIRKFTCLINGVTVFSEWEKEFNTLSRRAGVINREASLTLLVEGETRGLFRTTKGCFAWIDLADVREDSYSAALEEARRFSGMDDVTVRGSSQVS